MRPIPRKYEVYVGGKLHYTGSYGDAVAAARAMIARGLSTWLVRKGGIPTK